VNDLIEKFGAVADENAVDKCFIIAADKLIEAVKFLGFDVLIDTVGVDYFGMENHSGKRFAVIYCLKNTKSMERLRLKVQVEEKETIPTLSEIYPIADWQEREVWDQYGIVFENHHNLKRLLNHAEFEGHPLRKDYPAQKRQWLAENDKMSDQLEARLEKLGYKVI